MQSLLVLLIMELHKRVLGFSSLISISRGLAFVFINISLEE